MVDLYEGLAGETWDGFYIFWGFLYKLSFVLLCPSFFFVVTRA